jgi:acetyl-CoA carboxylase carboxyltransferase component
MPTAVVQPSPLSKVLARQGSSLGSQAAPRLWIDKIIDPMETRQALITALEAASLNPEVKEFKTGVLQT